jgi:hypothetical protein
MVRAGWPFPAAPERVLFLPGLFSRGGRPARLVQPRRERVAAGRPPSATPGELPWEETARARHHHSGPPGAAPQAKRRPPHRRPGLARYGAPARRTSGEIRRRAQALGARDTATTSRYKSEKKELLACAPLTSKPAPPWRGSRRRLHHPRHRHGK